jgi:serine/threonine-protein kinase
MSGKDVAPMIAAEHTACKEFVSGLLGNNLITEADLQTVGAFLRSHPQATPAELVEHLVRREVLTLFQAECLKRDKGRDLTLWTYTLVDALPAGSIGTVYKARGKTDDKWYAIKVLQRNNAMSISKVGNQLRAFARFRHPALVPIINIGTMGKRTCLIWPFVEGDENLDALVKRKGKLNPRQAASVLLPVIEGLHTAHKAGLYHGLLKPSDILVGPGKSVRLLDFGIGFLLATRGAESLIDTMTNSKALNAGLDCASPESILDSSDRTPAGDQYSLGCVLYYCLTGQFPFPRKTMVEKMVAHQEQEPEPVRDLNPDVSKRLALVVERLMAKAPDDRYENLEQVYTELRAATASSRPAVKKAGPAAEDKAERPHPMSNPLVLAGLAAGTFVASLLAWLLLAG